MAGPAQTFEVDVIIRAAVGLRFDVVNTGGLLRNALPKMVLAQPFIALQDARTDNLPLRTISTLLPRLAWLIGFPAFAFMFFAVTGWVCSGGAAAANTASFWCPGWHICSIKKTPIGGLCDGNASKVNEFISC